MSPPTPDLNAAIFTASDALTQIRKNKKSNDTGQIWIFTNNTTPCHGDNQVRVLQNTLHDKARQGTSVVVWPMGSDPLERYKPLGITVQPPPCRGEEEEDNDDDDAWAVGLQQAWKPVRPTWQLPLIRPDWKDHCRDPGNPAAGDEGLMAPAGIQLDWYDLISRGSLPSEVALHAYTGQYVRAH